MPQTSTTGSLENASREMITSARYTEEHNAPCMELVEKFTLQKGSDTLLVPKVGQMNVSALSEGQDLIDEEEIGMSTITVQASEVGAKIIITDKLLRENTQQIWQIVGRQLGEAMARKKDGDILSLFSALNGGTDLGATTKTLSLANTASCIGIAKADKYGSDLRIVHHPNAVLTLNKDLTGVMAGVPRPIPSGFSEDRLGPFWTGLRLSGVPIFEDGNIDEDTNGDGYGAIFDKGAIGVLTSVAMNREKQRDASLRATELVITSDYSAFEIDDTRGAPMLYVVSNPATNA
jgi:hypothetical protein